MNVFGDISQRPVRLTVSRKDQFWLKKPLMGAFENLSPFKVSVVVIWKPVV